MYEDSGRGCMEMKKTDRSPIVQRVAGASRSHPQVRKPVTFPSKYADPSPSPLALSSHPPLPYESWA